MVYAKPGKWDTQSSPGFWDTNRSPNLGQTTKPSNSKQEKENLMYSGLYRPYRLQSKIQRKRKDIWISEHCSRTKKKKTMEHEDDGDTNWNKCTWLHLCWRIRLPKLYDTKQFVGEASVMVDI